MSAKTKTGKRPRGVAPAWLQLGAAAIDNLSAEALAVALHFDKLKEPHRSALRKAVETAGKESKRAKGGAA